MCGADVAELRALAARFDRTADQLDANRMAVGNAIQISAWAGPLAARFRVEWNSEHSTRIHNAAQMLRANAVRLRHNADEQAHASVADGFAALTGRVRPGWSAAGVAIGGGLLSGFAAARSVWSKYDDLTTLIGTAKAATGLAFVGRSVRGLSMSSSVESLEIAMRYSSSYRAMSKVADMAEGGAKLGKILGPIGVAFGVVETVDKIQHGQTGLAILSGVSTALAAAALVPTPATPLLAAASAVVGVTGFVIEHHKEIGAAAKVALTTVASAAAPLANMTVDAARAASGFVASVAGKAANLWPWK